MMASLVFIGTFFFKIPVSATEGYIHLGDSMLILGVFLLGWKKGAAAASIGASLSDLLGGYAHWVFPTFIIKAIFAVIIGFTMKKLLPKSGNAWLLGSILGGIIQIAGYALTEIFYYGLAPAFASIPGNILQTLAGILIAYCLVKVLNLTHISDFLTR